MKPQTMRAIAIGLVLISATITILRMTGFINWDLGYGRLPILVVAIALLLIARRKEIRRTSSG